MQSHSHTPVPSLVVGEDLSPEVGAVDAVAGSNAENAAVELVPVVLCPPQWRISGRWGCAAVEKFLLLQHLWDAIVGETGVTVAEDA